METRIGTVYKSKSGSKSTSFRMTIPKKFGLELGLNDDVNKVKIIFDKKNQQLIIKKEGDNMYFVSGYYDDRIFKGDYFEGLSLYTNLRVSDLDGILKVPFIEGVVEWYEEYGHDDLGYDIELFEDLNNSQKREAIKQYMIGDELAFVTPFESKDIAYEWIEATMKEHDKIERDIKNGKIIFIEQKQNSEGYFQDVYVLAEDNN